MLKTGRFFKEIFKRLRREVHEQDTLGKIIVIIAVTFASIRIILPVWHRADGYVLYEYPFYGSAVCLERSADCQVDRSRTATGSIGFLLAAAGLAYIRKKRRR